MMIQQIEFPGLEVIRGKKANQVKLYNRKVGYIRKATMEYYKPDVDPIKHVFRKWNSIGIEKKILNAIELLGVKRICFKFKKKEGWYKIPLEVWQAIGKELTYGGNIQKHLPMIEINKYALTQIYDDYKKSETPRELKDIPTGREIMEDVINNQNRKLSDFVVKEHKRR
ncbi:MAG: hypothetical protein V3U92_19760 [Cellulophaga sp.]